MKASELRIGNYVLRADGSVALIETGSDITPFWNPVVLTEEWLLKFGFEYYPDKPFAYTDEETGNQIMSESRPHWGFKLPTNLLFNVYPDGDVFRYFFDTKVQYVHQLQNLYFALTGTELEIKL